MSLQISETRDIAACRALRRVVFIEEQGVSEAIEVDTEDEAAIHLLAELDGAQVGSARLLLRGDHAKIGRVCVLASARGRGIGAALIRAAVERLRQIEGVAAVKLGAQTHALGFYQALGFEAFGPEYQDAGIAHRDMILRF
jgi:predicted GNAT family N-acyltransferase